MCLSNCQSLLFFVEVLVFRGTSLDKSFQDVLHDAMIQPLKLNLRSAHSHMHTYSHNNIPLSPQPPCPFVYVHAGFYTAIENIFDTILTALETNNIQSFYLTGHSLGGALAQMFGLKYLVHHPLSQEKCTVTQRSHSCKLQHILTFAAPMVLWYGDGADISASASELLHPWRQKCLNFMYRADPVPLLPRMLSCKFCWNALIASATSQTSWLGSYLAQKYIAVPEEGSIPTESIFLTLKLTKGFVPPGLTAVLLGPKLEAGAGAGGIRMGAEQEVVNSVVLPPESVQKLATSFDTFVRPKDGFQLHSMSNYVACCLSGGSDGDIDANCKSCSS